MYKGWANGSLDYSGIPGNVYARIFIKEQLKSIDHIIYNGDQKLYFRMCVHTYICVYMYACVYMYM